AATTAPDSSFVQWTYVGAGVTSRTWTVSMPATAGTYEFRLFLNSTYVRGATSPPVTVTGASNPVPAVSSLSPPPGYAGGAAFTLTVYGSGFVSSSIVKWNGSPRPTTCLGASQLQAAIGSADVAATGTAQISVSTPAPGGGTSASLTFAIDPPPTLSV